MTNIDSSLSKDNSIDLSKINFNKIWQIMMCVIIINFIFSFIAYSFLYNEFSNVSNYFDFFYFGLSSITSVGYGDIVPVTRRAKIFVSMYLLFTFSMVISLTF